MEREYPVPGYEGYFATESGDIISYKRGQRKVLKQSMTGASINRPGRQRLGVALSRNKTRTTKKAHRLILSAKLGRKLEDWEQTCHMDGNHHNNSMANLEVGDCVNNSIDCLENGNRKSSPSQIKRAIKRLQKLVNGEEGIRTPGAREDTPVFKTGAINHSTTSPESLYEPLPTFS
tara:strand:+ start:4968 stop:5495 length:528 start_codon:yes stop_codon:yes gene_type:complete